MSVEKVHVEYQKMYYGFPVILVSYYDKKGQPNMASMSSSFSLGQMVTLGFANSGNTISCIKEMREFVINIPDWSMMRQIEMCGYTSGRDHDKFTVTGLTPVQSEIVNAPLVAECPIHLECRVESILTPASLPQYSIVAASVMGRLIDNKLLHEDGTLKSELVNPVLFIGDHHQRGYRYLDETRNDPLGTFLPPAIQG